MEILKLKKPIMIDGNEKTELSYDLDGLTGSDIQHAVRELAKKGIVVGASELDLNYHAALFAQASGISFDDMSRLSAKDYDAATRSVRDFFLEVSEE